jgi:uncharacterized membrane protein YcaP (DUF421 family)
VNEQNNQEQRFRVVIDGKIVNENFNSIQEAMEWAKVIVKEDSNISIETYLKPKLLLD